MSAETSEVTTRETSEQEKNVFRYLNLLRESGATNMFGATSYIVKKFKIGEKDAKSLLMLWMRNFNQEGNYSTIKVKTG